MEKIFENFTITIAKLNKLVQRIKLYEMEEFGLKAIHVMCGYYLYEHADGLTVSELSKQCLEDKAAISRAVATMCDKDLTAYDRTYNGKITLTEKGRAFAEAVGQKADRAVAAGSADMTEDERVQFYRTLDDIVANLKKYYDNLVKGE